MNTRLFVVDITSRALCIQEIVIVGRFWSHDGGWSKPLELWRGYPFDTPHEYLERSVYAVEPLDNESIILHIIMDDEKPRA